MTSQPRPPLPPLSLKPAAAANQLAPSAWPRPLGLLTAASQSGAPNRGQSAPLPDGARAGAARVRGYPRRANGRLRMGKAGWRRQPMREREAEARADERVMAAAA